MTGTRPGSLVVVMSTYNGARYLAAQIESILAQGLAEWSLLVRDDGSTDGTAELLDAFARRDARIRLVRDDRGNLGPVASFGVLLEEAWRAGAAYVALSDQDDVWAPDKLQRQVAAMREHEAREGDSRPILLHTDLTVVDESLRVVHPSFLAHQGLEHVSVAPLRRLLVQNFVTGCTVMVNRPLLRAALPLPPVIMHDWWLAQCAAAVGSLAYLPAATVCYRQHGGNVRGSPGLLRLAFDALRRPFAWWGEGRRTLEASARQAAALADRLTTLSADQPASPAARELVIRYHAALGPNVGRARRVGEVHRLGVRPRSLLRLVYYLRVWAMRSPGDAGAGKLWRNAGPA